MREDDLPRVLRSGTSEFAALADVPDPAIVRHRGDRRKRRNALLTGLLAFAIGAGGGGFAYAAISKQAPASTPVAGGSSHSASAGASGTSSAGTQVAGPATPSIVGVTTGGVVEVIDSATLSPVKQLTGTQDAVGDQVSVSPDGKTVYFAVKDNGCNSIIKSVPVDGSAAASPVAPNAQGVLPAVSPDGTRLAYVNEPHSGGPATPPVVYQCSG